MSKRKQTVLDAVLPPAPVVRRPGEEPVLIFIPWKDRLPGEPVGRRPTPEEQIAHGEPIIFYDPSPAELAPNGLP